MKYTRLWWRTTRRGLLGLCVVSLMSACTTPPRTLKSPDTELYRSGRMALQVHTEPPQTVSASFELAGNAQAGELRIHSPLGQSLARLVWRPGQALLQKGDESVVRASPTALVQDLTGTDLPVTALFDWLSGLETPVQGWQVDLTQFAGGRITARRLDEPLATLRVVLDR